VSGVAFFLEEYDVDVYSGRLECLDAWNYAIGSAGDIVNVAIINRTGLKPVFNARYNVQVFPTEEEFLSLASGDQITYVGAYNEFEETQSLWDFDHKTDWYFFGAASGHSGPKGITIPTADNMVLHSVHAATVVMAHRHLVTKWQ